MIFRELYVVIVRPYVCARMYVCVGGGGQVTVINENRKRNESFLNDYLRDSVFKTGILKLCGLRVLL